MEREAFDRLARAFGRAGSRRAALGFAIGGVAAALRGERVEAAAFDRDCDRFVLATRDEKKFRHLDDNMLIELQRKGSRGWKTIWDDTDDDNVNDGGDPFRIKPFRAHVGDKIRIQAFNLDAGPCDLDEVWLFCATGNSRGKRILDRYGSGRTCDEGERFIDETIRIRP